MRFTTRKTWIAAAALVPLAATLVACGSSSSSAGGGTSASSGSSTGASSGATKSTIVFGNIGTYAGAFGAQYLQSEHSLEAWAAFTNAHGGLNGHPVKIISKDDAGSPSTSLQDVKQLVESDHVVAIVDAMTPGTDGAWSAYVQQKKIPVVGGVSLDQFWLQNPYLFSTNVDTLGFLSGQFSAAKDVGSKLGLLICSELAACKAGVPLYTKIAAGIGLPYAGAQLVASTAVDYTAQCLALKNAGADVVIPELDGPTTKRAIDSCATQNFKPKIVVPASDLDANVLKDASFEGTTGVTVSPLWFGTSSVTKDWAAAYKAKYPNEVLNGYSTLGWQAGQVMAAVLKSAPDTVTSQTVLDGLYAQPAKSTYGGWTPPLTYTAGKTATTSPCLWYAQVSNGAVVASKGTDPVCAGS